MRSGTSSAVPQLRATGRWTRSACCPKAPPTRRTTDVPARHSAASDPRPSSPLTRKTLAESRSSSRSGPARWSPYRPREAAAAAIRVSPWLWYLSGAVRARSAAKSPRSSAFRIVAARCCGTHPLGRPQRASPVLTARLARRGTARNGGLRGWTGHRPGPCIDQGRQSGRWRAGRPSRASRRSPGMALLIAAGCSLLALGGVPLVHGRPG